MMIDYNVNIDFEDQLPESFIDLLRETEEYDRNGEDGSYINMIDAIDNGAKYLCEHGRISKEQWNRLMCKYKWWE